MNSFKSGKLLLTLLTGLLVAAPLYAQLPERLRDFPLATPGAAGEAVASMFNGWVKHEDGSVTMVFGFANLNRESIVDVPLGPNNKLEPAEFQGAQPTHFPVSHLDEQAYENLLAERKERDNRSVAGNGGAE